MARRFCRVRFDLSFVAMLGLVRSRFAPTHSPMRNGVSPHRLSPARSLRGGSISQAQISAARPLELLECQQPQRVAHQHRDAVLARAAPAITLQPAQAERVGSQAEVGFGLSAARGKPEQIGSCFTGRRAIAVIRSSTPGRFSRMNAS